VAYQGLLDFRREYPHGLTYANSKTEYPERARPNQVNTKSKLLVQSNPTVEPASLDEVTQRDNARSVHFDSSQSSWNETTRGNTADVSE
jgi:hypothetical protein